MRRIATVTAMAITLGCTACATAPVTPIPAIPVASNFKENQADLVSSGTTAAAPLQRSWWTIFKDADLDALELQLQANSPDLASALARYQQAKAAFDIVLAARSPSLNTSLNLQRDRQSDTKPLRGATSPPNYNSGTLAFYFSYEVDLWGRVNQQVSAGVAEQAAAAGDLAAAQLALQVQLADSFIALRGIDEDSAVLKETESAYLKAMELVSKRHQGGVASGLDLARAQAQLESTRSQISQMQAQRAILEHAIAALTGANPSTFSITPKTTTLVLPVIPAGVPSLLLQRRPDIAAAQFRIAAANERLGIARHAFFPSLTLGATAGFQSSDLARIVQMPNLYWVIGPTLAMSLLDGGRRNAQIKTAEAVLDETGQKYRALALSAIQQVEDQLAQMHYFAEASQSESLAAAAAQRATDLASKRYQLGTASYLEVVTAQTTSLQARRSMLGLSNRQQRASVQLIRALGGGWSPE